MNYSYYYNKTIRKLAVGLLAYVTFLSAGSIAGFYVNHALASCPATKADISSHCADQSNNVCNTKTNGLCCYQEDYWQHAFEQCNNKTGEQFLVVSFHCREVICKHISQYEIGLNNFGLTQQISAIPTYPRAPPLVS